MTDSLNALTSQRLHLIDAVNDAIEAMPYSHMRLLELQIARLVDSGNTAVWRPAMACLATAEALEGPQKRALPAAAALALIEAAGSVIDDLIRSEQGEDAAQGSLIHGWGLQRSLNAGDGLFALGQAILLWLEQAGVPEDEALVATELIDDACLRWLEDAGERLRGGSSTPLETSGAFIEAGVLLGARLAGVSEEAASAIAGFVTDRGTAGEDALLAAGIAAPAVRRLADVAKSLKGYER